MLSGISPVETNACRVVAVSGWSHHAYLAIYAYVYDMLYCVCVYDIHLFFLLFFLPCCGATPLPSSPSSPLLSPFLHTRIPVGCVVHKLYRHKRRSKRKRDDTVHSIQYIPRGSSHCNSIRARATIAPLPPPPVPAAHDVVTRQQLLPKRWPHRLRAPRKGDADVRVQPVRWQCVV